MGYLFQLLRYILDSQLNVMFSLHFLLFHNDSIRYNLEKERERERLRERVRKRNKKKENTTQYKRDEKTGAPGIERKNVSLSSLIGWFVSEKVGFCVK